MKRSTFRGAIVIALMAVACANAAGGSIDAAIAVADAPECTMSAQCDDDDMCTIDICEVGGTCTHTDDSGSCNDNEACTVDSCDPQTGCVNVPSGAPGTMTFVHSGARQDFIVPACVTSIIVGAWGAQGGTGDVGIAGGRGGHATATVPVSSGETLGVYVGGQGSTQIEAITGGFNGGGGVRDPLNQGTGPSGTGGGASDLRRGDLLADRLVVAGGGGGGGWADHQGVGGDGGGAVGADGNSTNVTFIAGGGGTQTTGGSIGWRMGVYLNEAGSFGQGGTAYHDGAGCGGGGGGWYGGGTGGFAGGGGGSGYVDAVGNTNTAMETGVRNGDGEVVISW